MNRIVELYLKLFHFWMRFPEKLRYLLVGGYNTVVSYALYALYLWLGADPQVALFLSFLVSSLSSYWTQRIYVFNTRGNVGEEYIKCLIAWGISYGLNAALLSVFLWMGLNPYVAQVVALILVTINSYLMLKHIAFRDYKKGDK